MERRLIAHGPSSLTISLPYKWIKRHELRKGDAVNISEEDRGLLITAASTNVEKDIRIDLKDYDYPIIVTILTTVYRRGYDTITLIYNNPEQHVAISQAIRNLLGFAIVDSRDKKVVINSLSIEKQQNIQSIFKRVFYILFQEFDDLGDSISKSKDLSQFYIRDQDVNTLVNLGIRLISKGYVHDRFEELHLFHVLSMLEEIGDDVIKLSIELPKNGTLKGLGYANQMLKMLFDAHFKGNITLSDFYKEYYIYFPSEKKKPVLNEFFNENPDLFYIRAIIEKIVNLAEILLLPEIK